MRWLKQSTSVDVPIGPFLDATDGVTAETALTITQPDIRLKKNGAAWAQKNAAQTLTHEENGNYEVTLDATDTNTLGLLRLHVAESGALPIWEDFMVLPANVYDALVGGSDNLQVHTVEITNGLIVAATFGAGAIDAAAIATGAIDADAIAANAITDAKVASDVTIASVTGAVGSVTAAVTVGTNNDKTGYGLSAAAVQAIWDALTSALTTAGSIGKLLVDNINATISSRLASASYTAPDNTSITAIKAKTDNLPASPAAVGSAMTLTSGERDSIADALLDRSNGIETSLTPRGAMRLIVAAAAGKLSGAATTTITIRNVGDTKARITATVDADGNRSAVTADAT